MAGGCAPCNPSEDTSPEPNHRFNAWRLHRVFALPNSARLALPAEACALRARTAAPPRSLRSVDKVSFVLD